MNTNTRSRNSNANADEEEGNFYISTTIPVCVTIFYQYYTILSYK